MDIIQVVLPPWNPYCIGCFAVVNMATEQLLCTGAPGETLVFPSDCAVDLGVAILRIGAPAVRLRFQTRPGRIYVVYWHSQGFGADLGVREAIPAAPRQT